MNRRAFIRTLAGGAAGVCGIPLLAQKQATGQVASLPGLLRANSEIGAPFKEINCRYLDEVSIKAPCPTFEEWLRTSEYANSPRAQQLLKRIEAQPKPRNFKLAY